MKSHRQELVRIDGEGTLLIHRLALGHELMELFLGHIQSIGEEILDLLFSPDFIELGLLELLDRSRQIRRRSQEDGALWEASFEILLCLDRRGRQSKERKNKNPGANSGEERCIHHFSQYSNI